MDPFDLPLDSNDEQFWLECQTVEDLEESLEILEHHIRHNVAGTGRDEEDERAAKALADSYMQQKAALHDTRLRRVLENSGTEYLACVGEEKLFSGQYVSDGKGPLQLSKEAKSRSPTPWQLAVLRQEKRRDKAPARKNSSPAQGAPSRMGERSTEEATEEVEEVQALSRQSAQAETTPYLLPSTTYSRSISEERGEDHSSWRELWRPSGNRSTSVETVVRLEGNEAAENSAGGRQSGADSGAHGLSRNQGTHCDDNSQQESRRVGQHCSPSEGYDSRGVQDCWRRSDISQESPSRPLQEPGRRSIDDHWQALDARAAPKPLLLNRNRTVTQRPPRRPRSDSDPEPDSPASRKLDSTDNGSPAQRARQFLGLDGACDDEDRNTNNADEGDDDVEQSRGGCTYSRTQKEEDREQRKTPVSHQDSGRCIQVRHVRAESEQREGENYRDGGPDKREHNRRIRSRSRSTAGEQRRPPIMPSNTGLARQAPGSVSGPQQQSAASAQAQTQQQVNGLGSGLPNGLAHAGHQTDINYLWGVVQELGDALTRNREQTAAIVARVQGMGGSNGIRTHEEGPVGRDQVNGDSQTNASAEIASLRSQLHQSQTALAETQAEASSLASINDDYVTFLHGTMDKIRTYAHSHSTAIIAVHAHYNSLLEQERESNMQLRIEHGEWQRGLGRAAEYARTALKERSEEVSGLERKMRETRAENMVLRRLVGWEVPNEEESDNEEQTGGKGAQGAAPAADRRFSLT